MIPDAEPMAAVARGLEEVGHEGGWDNEPPLLAVVIQFPGVENGPGFGALPFPVQPLDTSKDAVLGLSMIARMLQPGEPMAKFVLPASVDADRLAGWAFMSEAWTREASTDDRDGRRLADIPGSKECRFVHVVDCAGRYTAAHRIRGQVPTVDVVEPGAVGWEIQGRIPAALRDLVLAVAPRMSFGSVDLDAMRALVAHDAGE